MFIKNKNVLNGHNHDSSMTPLQFTKANISWQ